MNDKDVIASGAGGSSIARVGEPISFYLYEREEYVNPEDGTVVIVDQDESGGPPDEDDRIIAGSPFPDFMEVLPIHCLIKTLIYPYSFSIHTEIKYTMQQEAGLKH